MEPIHWETVQAGKLHALDILTGGARMARKEVG